MSDHGATVDRLFEETGSVLADSTADRETLVESDDLQSIAAEASDLVESTDAGALLATVGFDVDEESDPIDLVSAISEADAEPLVRLRRLKLLADVDRAEDDPVEALESFESFDEFLAERDEASDDAVDALDDALRDAAERLDALGSTDSADDPDGEPGGDTDAQRSSTAHSTMPSRGRSNPGRRSRLSTVSRVR